MPVGRLLTAVVGGIAVTLGLLLVMSQATKHFNVTDPMRYFRIVDFIPAPEGSDRPEPPPAPLAPPQRPGLQHERSENTTLRVDPPAVEAGPAVPAAPAPVLPELEDVTER